MGALLAEGSTPGSEANGAETDSACCLGCGWGVSSGSRFGSHGETRLRKLERARTTGLAYVRDGRSCDVSVLPRTMVLAT